ncbi:polysaccharide deacetylase family protein [Candidatus Sumerlaeota bacterium]|nr:polysaccharide deacetylase family protein [Candidatus Sumerlaeota bacterium]
MRPPAFIHVDCDSLWAVRSCYGPMEASDPSGDRFWTEGVPAALELFQGLGIPATLFAVSQDLEIEVHAALARRAVEEGHEIASHSHTHIMDLRSVPLETLRCEVNHSRAVIESTVGVSPVGFRSPGFSWSPDLPSELERAGYLYDSSLFPSPWGPPLRWMRRLLGTRSERPQRPYGGWRAGWGNRLPRTLGSLLEIPVSVTPRLRLPAHASFALLRGESKMRSTLHWHAWRGLPFVWVIHLIDLCDTSDLDLPTPRWSKGMFCQPADRKRERLRSALGWIAEDFEIVRTDRWARSELDRLADAGD